MANESEIKKAKIISYYTTCSSCTVLELYSTLTALGDPWEAAGPVQ